MKDVTKAQADLRAEALARTSNTSNLKRFFTKSEVLSFNVGYWVNDKQRHNHIAVLNVALDGSVLMLKGFVESESRRGFYHYVIAPVHPVSIQKLAGKGKCDCESAQYNKMPCKHVIRLRNIYIRHKSEFDAIFGVPQLRR